MWKRILIHSLCSIIIQPAFSVESGMLLRSMFFTTMSYQQWQTWSFEEFEECAWFDEHMSQGFSLTTHTSLKSLFHMLRTLWFRSVLHLRRRLSMTNRLLPFVRSWFIQTSKLRSLDEVLRFCTSWFWYVSGQISSTLRTKSRSSTCINEQRIKTAYITEWSLLRKRNQISSVPQRITEWCFWHVSVMNLQSFKLWCTILKRMWLETRRRI